MSQLCLGCNTPLPEIVKYEKKNKVYCTQYCGIKHRRTLKKKIKFVVAMHHRYSVPCPNPNRKVGDRHFGDLVWFGVKRSR